MKNIAVILPVNNHEMLNQEDLTPYQSKDYFFKLTYVDTHLKELNTTDDAAIVVPLVIKKAQQAEHEGASAIIVYAFGDIGIKEIKNIVSIPVMGLGKSAIHMASLLCRNTYTVLPSMLQHNAFIKELILEEKLEHKFIPASHSVEISPKELKANYSKVLEKLIDIACIEYKEKGIDTFTLGCGCFIGIAKKLEIALNEKLQHPIIVIDPVATPFNIAKLVAI